MLKIAHITIAIVLLVPSKLLALPDLRDPVVYSDGDSIFVVYKDHDDEKVGWILPNTLSINVDNNNQPKIYVVHWGLTEQDHSGSGMSVSLEMTPKALIPSSVSNRYSEIRLVPVSSSYLEILLDDRFLYDQNNRDTVSVPEATLAIDQEELETLEGSDAAVVVKKNRVAGATPGSPQAFNLSLNDLGGRVLASGDNSEIDIMVANYTYSYQGIGPRLHAKMTVNWKKATRILSREMHAKIYYGVANPNIKAVFKKMMNDGAVILEILDGGTKFADAEDNYIKKVFDMLVDSYIGGDRLFKMHFKHDKPPPVPNGKSSVVTGWGFNSSTFYEKIEENYSTSFTFNVEEVQTQSSTIGMSFGPYCAMHTNLFRNITNNAKPCVTSVNVRDFMERITGCYKDVEAQLIALGLEDETLAKTLRDRLVKLCG